MFSTARAGERVRGPAPRSAYARPSERDVRRPRRWRPRPVRPRPTVRIPGVSHDACRATRRHAVVTPTAPDSTRFSETPHARLRRPDRLGRTDFFKKVEAEIEASERRRRAARRARRDARAAPCRPDHERPRSLQLNGWSKGAARDAFLACKRLRRLRSLNLFNIQSRSPHRIVEQLFGAVRFERLESLDLDGSALGDDGVAALAASPSLARLQRLKLSSCDLSEELA